MAMDIEPGVRVVRGPDWKWGDQDGGDGCVGTVSGIRKGDGRVMTVCVQWDAGGRENYRCGYKDNYDLRIYDTAQIGIRHTHVKCDICDEEVVGIKWKCATCYNLNLCTPCYNRGKHDVQHEFMRVEKPGGSGTRVPPRHRAEREAAKGLFVGAEVIRGYNWDWEEQDGGAGQIGKITAVEGIRTFGRSVVKVLWRVTMSEGQCRAGLLGKVDVQCKELGNGGYFYPDHLPVLGADGYHGAQSSTAHVQSSLTARDGKDPTTVPKGCGIKMDDLKRIAMGDNCSGIVAAAIVGDENKLRKHLARHPEDVNTKIAGKAAIHCAALRGHYNVLEALLEYSANIEIEDNSGNKPLHLAAHCNEDQIAILLIYAKANVNSRNNDDSTPLMAAAMYNHTEVLKVLVSHPDIDLNLRDKSGDTALHYAVLSKEKESVSILLEAGSNPKLVNLRLSNPIHEAANTGFLSAMELFASKCPDLVCVPKHDGSTALHLATMDGHYDIISMLLERDLCNIDAIKSDISALHIAVRTGHSRIVEKLVGFGCKLDSKDNDGNTPLNYAFVMAKADPMTEETPQLKKVHDFLNSSLNCHPKAETVVAFFLAQEGADIFAANNRGMASVQLCPPSMAPLLLSLSGKQSYKKFHGSLCSRTKLSETTELEEKKVSMPMADPVPAAASISTSKEATGSKPSVNDLERLKIISAISSKWRQLGLCLGVSMNELDNIREREMLDNYKCCARVFYHWIKNDGCPPEYPLCWKAVYKVLCAIDHRRTANDMKETLADWGTYID